MPVSGPVDTSEENRAIRRTPLSVARQSLIFHAFFFFSGFTSLVYEVGLVRMFLPVLGVGVHSVTAVLCAFFTGMAAGSFAVPRLRGRWRNPALLYPVLEGVAGLSMFVMPLGARLLMDLYEKLAPLAGERLAALRFGLALAGMVIPTLALGGAFPACVALWESLAGQGTREPRRLARFYGANLIGAAAGCSAASLVLIPNLGVTRAMAVAAVLSLLLAAAARWVGRGHAVPVHAAASPGPGMPRVGVYLAFYFVMGLVTLSFELVWYRALVLYIGATVHCFAILLTTFLLGSGLGSHLMGFCLWRLRNSSAEGDARWLSVLVLATALANLASFYLISVLDRVIPPNDEPAGWGAFLAMAYFQSALFVLPSVMVLGALFALLAHALERQGLTDSRSAADLFAANSIGGAAGAVVTTFVLLETLGVQNTVRVLCGLLGVMGMLWVLPQWKRAKLAFALSLAVMGIVVAMGFSQDVLKAKLTDLLGEIVFYKESSQDITLVHRLEGSPDLRLAYHDGRGTCSTRFAENEVARLLAHTSMAMNPRAKHILVISFGCGNTASAFAKYPVESIDIVDISRSVRDAADYFWTNQGVAKDPRVTFHVEDGRNFLLRSRKRYDVIELEPPNLMLDSVVYLYTQDFYVLAKSRLNPGGIVSQWINFIKTGRETSLSLIHSMTTQFPNSAVFGRRWAWWVNGRREDAAPLITYAAAREALDQPAIRNDLTSIRMSFSRVMGTLLAAGPPLHDTIAASPVMTDDWTMADDTAPKYWMGYVTPREDVPIPQFYPPGRSRALQRESWRYALHGFPAGALDALPDTALEFSDDYAGLMGREEK